jgi:hypothetical protein
MAALDDARLKLTRAWRLAACVRPHAVPCEATAPPSTAGLTFRFGGVSTLEQQPGESDPRIAVLRCALRAQALDGFAQQSV